ncbi:MAG: DUF4198 domain-containing protein [Hyphomicrobiaceae bacterium]
MRLKPLATVAAVFAIMLPTVSYAHRAWLLPSATVLSGDSLSVTIDAAVSNDLFYFEHRPMRLDQLAITAPDGSSVAPENTSTGKFRSTFDLTLTKPGTYRVALTGDGAFARYKLNGQMKRLRGSVGEITKKIPADAAEVEITQSQRRIETFITIGKPSDTLTKLTGKGLELLPVTHPNDVVAGNETAFKFMLDGKPAANVKVALIRGGSRYRNSLEELNIATDREGKVVFKPTVPGMYWISASVQDDKTDIPNGKSRRATYSATFEVLPE